MPVSKRVVLHFPQRSVDRPIVSQLVREYNLDFNILKASVSPYKEGLLVMEITGEQQDFDRGIRYLRKSGVRIQSLSQDVTRNEERCTHCGACVAICPADAFIVDPQTRLVSFDNEKCLACEICIEACPPRAMEVHF